MHPLAPLKTFRADAAAISDDFSTTKRDKRLMKHSSFMSRVADSGIAKKKTPKRTGRGRSQKLATTMEGLADALPELEDGEGGVEALQGKIRHKSIKSKKGALKRKEQVVKGEMERFGNSMAQMAGTQEGTGSSNSVATGRTSTTSTGGGTAPTSAGASNRWAALRGYISSTMEQNPAFAGRQ